MSKPFQFLPFDVRKHELYGGPLADLSICSVGGPMDLQQMSVMGRYNTGVKITDLIVRSGIQD